MVLSSVSKLAGRVLRVLWEARGTRDVNPGVTPILTMYLSADQSAHLTGVLRCGHGIRLFSQRSSTLFGRLLV